MMREIVQRAHRWYAGARHRAQRRRSRWNLILVPLGLAGWLGVWYWLFRLVWAFHVTLYPQHKLRDFWREGVSLSSFMLSFLTNVLSGQLTTHSSGRASRAAHRER